MKKIKVKIIELKKKRNVNNVRNEKIDEKAIKFEKIVWKFVKFDKTLKNKH